MPFLCLILEPELATARQFQAEFPLFGFKPHVVGDCRSAMALLGQWKFDAVMLDADGMDDNPIAALRKLRRRCRAPLVLLTREQDEEAQLSALESGALDVFMLPASTRLLAARLRRLIEASIEPDDEPLEVSVGPLFMNARHGNAAVGRRPLVLTPHQFELLYALATRLGQFVQRETLSRALRSSGGEDSRSVDVHVHRVRKKLRDIGATTLHLDTVHGRGYCLSIDLPAPDPDADDETSGSRDPAYETAHGWQAAR